MKILMLSRATLFTHPGGDTIQIIKTASFLNNINGVNVEIKTVNDVIEFSKYHLLHLFNTSRPADFLGVIKNNNIPYVISTIFIDYSEVERNHYFKARVLLSKVFNSFQLEYLKTIGRIFKNQDILTDKSYFFIGQKKSIKKVLESAALLLPNSQSEYQRLRFFFNTKTPYRVVPNAVDIEMFDRINIENKNFDIYKGSVIIVGQITPVKNHLTLIKALNNTKYNVFIIGSPSSNANKYYEKCRKESSKNIVFVPWVSQNELAIIYSKAKIHVLPSWFETTGLASLEAAYMGCNVVITDRGDQKEYFQNDAYYCNPESSASILDAVDRAYSAKKPPTKLIERIKSRYNWYVAAQETFVAYKEVLNQNNKSC